MERLQISIPKPCHQDWNQMTPEERGRFCSMCKKTVHDFSEKTEDEIREFIKSHRNENLCGRFRNDQLTQPERIELPLSIYRSQLSFLNVFLVALLFCFGTSLFACNITPPRMVGEVEIYIPEKAVQSLPDSSAVTKIDSVVDEVKLMGDTIISEQLVLGGMEIPEYPGNEEQHLKGKVVIESAVTEVDSTINLPPVEIIDSTIVVSCVTTGLMAVQVEDDNPSLDTDSANEKTVPEKTVSTGEGVFIAEIYPNPSTGLVNLKLKPAGEQNVQIDLYDMNGKLIRNLASEIMQAELRTMGLDLTDLTPGIYFLKITAGSYVKTERVIIADR